MPARGIAIQWEGNQEFPAAPIRKSFATTTIRAIVGPVFATAPTEEKTARTSKMSFPSKTPWEQISEPIFR